MLLTLILLPVTLASCGGDDDDEPSLIVGTWVGTAMDDGYSKTYEYDFKANGSFTWKVWFTDNPDMVMAIPGTYSYDANKGILSVRTADEDGDVYEDKIPCKITNGKMEIESDGRYLILNKK